MVILGNLLPGPWKRQTAVRNIADRVDAVNAAGVEGINDNARAGGAVNGFAELVAAI
jgi:hypothetical protein